MTDRRGREFLIDEMPAAIFITDRQGHVRSTNEALRKWSGLEAEQLVGHHLTEVLTSAGRIHLESSVLPELVLHGELTDIAVDVRRTDGSVLHLLCNAAAWGGERTDEVTWLGLDISDRRARERELEVAQRRIGRLQSLSSKLVSADDTETVAQTFLSEMVDGVKADSGQVILELDGALLPVARRSLSPDCWQPGVEDERWLTERVDANTASFEALSDLRPSAADGSAVQVAALPLEIDGSSCGVIVLAANRDGPHSNEEREVLLAASRMCAVAIGRCRYHDLLRDEADRTKMISDLLHRLDGTTSVVGRVQLVADALVPGCADFAVVELVSPTGSTVAVRHRERRHEPAVRQLRDAITLPTDRPDDLAVGGAAHDAQIATHLDATVLAQADLDAHQMRLLSELQPHSYIRVPLLARNEVLGSMMLAYSTSQRSYRDPDMAFLTRVADAAGQSLENARLYEHERSTASELQAALLPHLPSHPRLTMSGRYETGADLAAVGGDWYDVFELSDDRLGLVIGDIVGGGTRAAAAMGQLKVALQAYALEGHGVGRTLEWLDRFTATLEAARLASLIYAELDLATNELTYTAAGHLPPLLVPVVGASRFLWDARWSLLGANHRPAPTAKQSLSVGDTVLLYTDGLIERPDRSIDDGLETLRQAIEADRRLVHDLPLLVALLKASEHNDDTCILSITLDR